MNGADPGESGRADRVMSAQRAYAPIEENVLIQARTPTGERFADSAELRNAARDLVLTLRGRRAR